MYTSAAHLFWEGNSYSEEAGKTTYLNSQLIVFNTSITLGNQIEFG